jgi:hypothetical protein
MMVTGPVPVQLSPEALRRRKLRNWALLGVLMAFVVLIFVISIVKMAGTA